MTGPAGLSLGVDDATCRQLTGRGCLEQPNSQPVDASNPQLSAPGAQGAASPIAGGLGASGGLPVPEVVQNPPVIPPPPVRDGSEVPAAPAETPTDPETQETQPSAGAQSEGEDTTSVTNGGEPHVSAEAEVEGGQASPPDPSKIESISDFRIFLRSLGIDDQKLTDEMLEDGELTHDELEQADPNHERYITDAAFNLVSRGGLGINVFGGVAADEDGINYADAERFMEKVIEPLVDGTKSQAEVIARFMHASRFRVIPRHAMSRTFREQTHSREGLWETNNGVSTLSAKTFLDKYIRPELRELAGEVLANILGHAVTDSDRLSEEQLDTFMLTIYYLARIDEPREVMEGAKAITDLTDQLEGSTPETFITWLTKGAENPVQAAETSSAEQSQQNPQSDMPEELKEGLKNLYQFENGQFVSGADGSLAARPTISTEEYRDAIAHFERVLSNSDTSAINRQRAAQGMMQCYQALSQAARTIGELSAVIGLAEGQMGTIETVLGADKVIELRQLWIQLANALSQNGSGEDIVFAQVQALAQIFTRPNIPAGLVAVAIPGEIARLAFTCADLMNLGHRQYALTLAEGLPDRFTIQSQGQNGQSQSQEITRTDLLEQLKAMVENHPLLRAAETKFYQLMQGLQENPLPAAQLSTKLTEIAGDYQRAIDALVGDADPISVEDLAQARLGRARCLAYAALPGMILGTEMEGAALTSAAQTLLNLLKEVVGIDPEQEFAPTGAGLLALSITTLNELIAQATDPEIKERLEGLRDSAIRTLVIIAQTLVQASTARGLDSAARGQYRQAYRAIAQLMRTLGLEDVSLEPAQEGGEPTPLGGSRGLIRALEQGLRTSISPREIQRRIVEETVGTPPPAPRDRERRGRRRRS